jgi:uncharacterized protein with HEPN domain
MCSQHDRIRLRHMLDAAYLALSFVEDETRDRLDADPKLRFALTRTLEIIGEAASRITPECQAQHPQIPWSLIVGMRNRLIHAYFDINLDQVWDTVTGDLPSLVEELQKILSDEPEADE